LKDVKVQARRPATPGEIVLGQIGGFAARICWCACKLLDDLHGGWRTPRTHPDAGGNV